MSAANEPLAARLSAAFVEACLLDVMALKPGNVGIHGAGHGMETTHFIQSALAAAPALCREHRSIGERIHDAIAATHEAVGINTNLGIVLLCAPIAHAVHRTGLPASAERMRAMLTHCLSELTVADAELAYAAIRLANPGGLGSAERHDVKDSPRVTLLAAMREAADRDSIARQYATGYADLFDEGLPAFESARAQLRDRRFAATRVYLRLLATLTDAHVTRKLGADVARTLRETAAQYEAGDRAALLAWDAALKARGINPGTSADLTVATVFLGDLTRSGASAGSSGFTNSRCAV